MMKLTRFLDRLPEETSVLKLLIGSSRKQTTEAIFVLEGTEPTLKSTGDITPELIDWDSAAELILSEAEALGWGSDHTHIRLNAKLANGSHLKSVTISTPLESEEQGLERGDQSQSILHLTNGLLAMSREVRNTLAIVSDSLAHRESVYADVLSELLDARRDQADAESSAQAMHMQMSNQMGDAGNEFKHEALSQLGEIVKTVMGGKTATAPTLDQIKNWASENPTFWKDLFSDPEIVQEVMRHWQAQEIPSDDLE